MSHFTVLVIGHNPEDQLQPFQENNMDDCPKEYLAFNSVEDEYKERFAKENPNAQYESEEAYKVAFDSYLKDRGYEKDPTTGQYGYWENPNAKWDWYQLGGRWTGFFKLKADANKEFAIQGSAGLMTKPAGKGYADTALKRDIDIAGMRAEEEKEAKERYERIESIFPNGIPKIEIAWSKIIDSDGPYKDMSRDDRREFYHNQEGVKAWKEATHLKADEVSDDLRSFYIWADQEDFQCSKEEYIKKAGDGVLLTFAVLKDGKWYERGEMGWWACVSNEKSEGEWEREFSQLIDELPEDTLLSVYDCHI
jgi:hypothetical protein